MYTNSQLEIQKLLKLMLLNRSLIGFNFQTNFTLTFEYYSSETSEFNHNSSIPEDVKLETFTEFYINSHNEWAAFLNQLPLKNNDSENEAAQAYALGGIIGSRVVDARLTADTLCLTFNSRNMFKKLFIPNENKLWDYSWIVAPIDIRQHRLWGAESGSEKEVFNGNYPDEFKELIKL